MLILLGTHMWWVIVKSERGFIGLWLGFGDYGMNSQSETDK
jgi:hypothetical protein